MKERRNIKRYNIRTFKEPDKRDNLVQAMKWRFEANTPCDEQTEEDYWKTIETNIKGATEKLVRYNKQEGRKHWMLKEILIGIEDSQLDFFFAAAESLQHNST